MSTEKADELVAHPLVLRAAWRRLESWYRVGEVSKATDLARWQLDPEGHLYRLSEKLRAGDYRPSKMTLLPYPKKGAILRHYCAPKVEDQVAMLGYLILLAPALEAAMPNVSYGNRWFRKVYRNDRDPDAEWRNRAFSLADGKMYEPYSRAFGLFRRVAHWTASRMMGSNISSSRATGPSTEPEDYPDKKLPPFVNRNWWGDSDIDRAYWAGVDFKLAFPSVKISILEGRMRRLIDGTLADKSGISTGQGRNFGIKPSSNDSDPLQSPYRGYPADLQSELEDQTTRKNIVKRFCNQLGSIEYDTATRHDVPEWDELWHPSHIDHELPKNPPEEHTGLPTGLAVSNFLLNVYLSPIDYRYIDEVSDSSDNRYAFLRFADDITILADSRENLLEAIDNVWAGAREKSDDSLVSPDCRDDDANLRINWGKMEPEPVQDVAREFLEAHDREWCEVCEKPETVEKSESTDQEEGEVEEFDNLSTWYAEHGDEEGAGDDSEIPDSFGPEDGDHVITAERPGPFVTYLVERMSTLSREDFEERFGDPARERLVQLHELIRFDFDDHQVGKGTRFAFAANRLVRAWLPEDDPEDDAASIGEIRHSIRRAVHESYQNFHLWRAVIRAAVRRPIDGDPTDHDHADAWLRGMLKLIVYRGSSESEEDDREWPAEQVDGCRRPDGEGWKRLTVSFLRASFWRHLASAISALRFEKQRRPETEDFSREGSLKSRAPSSRSWLFRAVDSDALPEVLNWLSDIDRWANVLYGGVESVDLHSWELDALVKAVLVTNTRDEVWKSCTDNSSTPVIEGSFAADDLEKHLHLPDEPALFPRGSSVVRNILVKNGRTFDHLGEEEHVADYTLGLLKLVPETRPPGRRFCPQTDPQLGEDAPTLRIANRLGLMQDLEPGVADALTEKVSASPEVVRSSEWEEIDGDSENTAYLRLQMYALARRFLRSLGRSTEAVGTPDGGSDPTIHRVLWGKPASNEDITGWDINPAESPSLELPLRVSLRCLRDALESDRFPFNYRGRKPQTWKINREESAAKDPRGAFAQGRLHQKGQIPQPKPVEPEHEWIETTTDWESLPHPLFFLPYVFEEFGEEERVPCLGEEYDNWCHLLHFLTCVDGSERILDRLFSNGFGTVPFRDRWWVRGRVHLDGETWKYFGRALRWFEDELHRGPDSEQQDLLKSGPKDFGRALSDLKSRLRELDLSDVSSRDFLHERVDVRLEIDDDFEEPHSLSRFPSQPLEKPKLPDGLNPDDFDDLDKDVPVRLAQIEATPDLRAMQKRFPVPTREEIQHISKQIWAATTRENVHQGNDGDSKDIILLPELAVPHSELHYLRQLPRSSGVSILAGTIWRPMHPAARPHATVDPDRRFLVNEAVLSTPVLTPRDDDEFWRVREFRIRKPTPSHLERGYAAALSERGHATFEMLPGRKWYRFVHPNWGDFTVGICADLLDPTPWESLRGDILHLFLCAYNKDVDLFDSLSWVRAYETYANVAVTNHGKYGGSFAWTPQSSHRKEIAKLRGNGLFVLADVDLPVQSLKEAQESGVDAARQAARDDWNSEDSSDDDSFKSPPPSYPGREE